MDSDICLTPTTAYLAGVVIGDGNLSNGLKPNNSRKTGFSKDYRIVIELSDYKYLRSLYHEICLLIKTKSVPTERLEKNRKPRLRIQIRNKQLYSFFNETMEIPAGHKSSTVLIPRVVKEGTAELKKQFLAGYFDTDGGFRGGSLGFTTGSEQMNKDVSDMLDEFCVDHSKDQWVNKKYNRLFYGIRIKKSAIDKLLNVLPLKNFEKLERIKNRFIII